MKRVPFLCRALVACGIALFVFQIPAAAQTGTVNLTISAPVPPAVQTGANPNSYSMTVPTHTPTLVTIYVSDPSDPPNVIVGATNVTLTFNVPKGVKVTVTSPPCTLSRTGGGNRQVTCTIGDIALDGTYSLSFGVESAQAGLASFVFDATTPDELPLSNGNNMNVALNITFQ